MGELIELLRTISINKEFSSLVFALAFMCWILKTILDFAIQKQDSEIAKMRMSVEMHTREIAQLTSKITSCRFRGD